MKKTNKIKYEDLFVAIYINIPVLNVIISVIAPFFMGRAMALLYITITVLLFFCQLKKSFCSFCKFDRTLFLISIYLIIVFVISKIGGHSDLLLVEFLVYTVIPMLFVPRLELNYENILMYCPIVTAFGLVFINRIFVIENNTISMGLSYVFMPPIIFSLLYLYQERKSKLATICSAANMIYLLVLLLYGSRGPLISIVVFVVFLFVLKQNEKGYEIAKKRLFFIIILGVILFLGFWHFINSVNNIVNSFGVKFSFLDKLLLLKNFDDVNNGRTEIYQTTLQLICKRPILGYGISTFDFYTSMEYPHNFILQMLFDIGVVGSGIVLIPAVRGIITILKNLNKDLIFVMAIACSSIPGALFSGDLWKNVLLWLTFSLFIKYTRSNKYESVISYV